MKGGNNDGRGDDAERVAGVTADRLVPGEEDCGLLQQTELDLCPTPQTSSSSAVDSHLTFQKKPFLSL